MKKNLLSKVISAILLIAITLSVFGGCSGDEETSSIPENVVMSDYSVTVKSVGGMALENIAVSIYRADDREDLVWTSETDEDGKLSFKADSSKSYVAVLSGVPEGYKLQNLYNVSKDTVIILETKMVSIGDLSGYTCKLGSIARDFSITATDGKTYKLSELLKEKKAVVLNFWFIGCNPCRMEFPFMQQAYTEYSDKIEILALNPYDGTDESVKAYAKEMKLTFPVAACENIMMRVFGVSAFPATMVIDRYGMVAFAHVGSITDKETFTKIFEHFTADDYQQRVYKNLSDFN